MVLAKNASYTKPELRDRIKSRVMASGDGGKPGQWSARKAQLVAQKYESAGGGYSGAKTEGQKSLSKWTDQKWTTSDGKPAERKGGTTRYLPEKAWDKLSPSERSATNAKKREGSREGEQFVKNTEAAAEARKESAMKKEAVVRPDLKNFRRALVAIANKDLIHAFPEGSAKAILTSGVVLGSKDQIHPGVHFSKGLRLAGYGGARISDPMTRVSEQAAANGLKFVENHPFSSPASAIHGDYKLMPKTTLIAEPEIFAQNEDRIRTLRLRRITEDDHSFADRVSRSQKPNAMINREFYGKRASDSGAWQRSEGKNPEGGLNAKGRASLKAQGHDIKPGVKGPADTPEKMKRKGSFLSRMFGPGAPGAMKKDNGEPSRRALSAKAWGEPVPSDDAGRARLYAKGQAMLKRYSGKEKEAAWDFPKRVAKDLYMGFQNPIEAFSALPKNVRLSLTADTLSDKFRELARDAAEATGAAAGAAGRLGAAYVVGKKLYNLLPSQAEPAQALEEDHGVKTSLAHFKLSNAPGFPVEALREAMAARQGAPVSNQDLMDALHSAANAKARAHTPLPKIFAPQPRPFWGESPAQFAGSVALPIAAYGLHRAYKYFNPDRPAVKTAAFNAVLQVYGLEKDAFSFSDT